MFTWSLLGIPVLPFILTLIAGVLWSELVYRWFFYWYERHMGMMIGLLALPMMIVLMVFKDWYIVNGKWMLGGLLVSLLYDRFFLDEKIVAKHAEPKAKWEAEASAKQDQSGE